MLRTWVVIPASLGLAKYVTQRVRPCWLNVAPIRMDSCPVVHAMWRAHKSDLGGRSGSATPQLHTRPDARRINWGVSERCRAWDSTHSGTRARSARPVRPERAIERSRRRSCSNDAERAHVKLFGGYSAEGLHAGSAAASASHSVSRRCESVARSLRSLFAQNGSAVRMSSSPGAAAVSRLVLTISSWRCAALPAYQRGASRAGHHGV